MPSFRVSLRRTAIYRELRLAYHAARDYGKLRLYLANRFWYGPRLARLSRPLDRPVDTDRYTIHLMCGQRDLLGALWALASWHAVAADSAQVFIHEDGTFTAGDRARIARLMPDTRIVDHTWATSQAVGAWLADQPILRGYREARHNIFAVKLLDPYFVSPAQGVLILDGDALWFDTPRELHEHIDHYTTPIFWPSSGDPMRLGFKDAGELRHDLAALNTGLVYFEKRSFDLKIAAEFFEKLDPEFHYRALFDQPAYAYTLGEYAPVTTLPVEQYHIHGAAHAGTVGKHYTGPRREQFWFEGVERLRGRLLP